MEEGARAFSAKLRRDDRNLGWTVADVPFDPQEIWPGMQGLRVLATVAGARGHASFRSSLFARVSPECGFYLLVNRAALREAGLELGDVGSVTLAPDLKPRPAELPDALDMLLEEAEGLRPWYEALSEYKRREIGKWVSGVTSHEARERRAQQMAERLLATMEAETALPPVLVRAFAARPRAREGWELTPVAARRAELMALFSYKSPEAQEKRLTKLLAAAELRAEKHPQRKR